MAAVTRTLVAAALLAFAPIAAHAQGTGRSMDFETSIRAVGMGVTSCGVTWGDPEAWGNVATLGRVSGVRWEYGHTQLVPDLASDVFLRSERVLVGAYGVGVEFMGDPSGLGHLRLDYGLSTMTDGSGNVIGTFSSYETVAASGIGVSLPRLVDGVLALAGRPSHLADVVDFAGGVAAKRTYMQLAPASQGGAAAADSRDWGLQARLSPLQLLPPAAAGGLGLRELLVLDLGYGRSVLNASGGQFAFLFGNQSAPPTRMKRSGFAVRAGVNGPWTLRSGSARWLAGLSPLFAVGYASDHDDNDAGGTGRYAYELDHDGIEVTFANVVTLRHGHYTDRSGEIDGDTSGWGIGVPLGPWAGFRYDHATMPEAAGLSDVKRNGWTAWVDVVRIAADLHGRQNEMGGGR